MPASSARCELLPEDIRPLVKGLVINKFRGDPAILGSGLKSLEELTGVPVLGVLPYLDLDIPSEDSVSLGDKKAGPAGEQVEIAVIRLPRISNFTDFEPLERSALVRYVELDEPLGHPDAVIIPGTKNTVSDLQEMQAKGHGGSDKIPAEHADSGHLRRLPDSRPGDHRLRHRGYRGNRPRSGVAGCSDAL